MTGNLQWWVCSRIERTEPRLSGMQEDAEAAYPEYLFRSNAMRASAIARQILGSRNRQGMNLEPAIMKPHKRNRKLTVAGTVLVNRHSVVYYRKEEE